MIQDKRIVRKKLLPPKFDYIATTIEESKDISKMTV